MRGLGKQGLERGELADGRLGRGDDGSEDLGVRRFW